MRGQLKIAAALTVGLALVACEAPGASGSKAAPTTQKDQASYVIGTNIGRDMKRQAVDVNPDMVARGIRDMLEGRESLINDSVSMAVMEAFQKEMMAKQETVMAEQETERKAAGEKNLKTSEEFLAKKAAEEGVKVLESGLQYKVIKEGSGKSPGPQDEVTVHYRGTLIDGTEFDSSIKRGEPATFPVGGVIPGWTEALQLMSPGAKWELYIPSKLAYGDRGAGDRIGPNSALVFEVELLSVNSN